ncbi:ATP-binding protein [Paractinoplanes durhamensis]|nr:ATP-binding protein [Actinoplanes durhamensis]
MESFGVDVSGGYRLPRPEALMTEFLLLKPAAPEQLPRDVRGFTGRSAELVRLDALADGAIALLTGPAGIGKTALAVRWGHRAAERFPDGQLFVNLRGFDHVVPPMEPAEALRRLLTALGVPTRRVPAGLDERAALYRAEMADRRALVVLDNAGVATQVRPLLAAARNCVTVVTCRNQLTGLIVREGAQPAEVPPLAPAEAAQLLGHRLGPDRVAGETLAVADMIDRCARLPLALSLAAARAAGRPRRPLADLVGEIGAPTGCGHPHADVRAVFAWSYRALSATAARLFRMLGRHPAHDLTATATAGMAGLTVGQATVLLAELARAGLLSEFAPGRYSCHDLLRTYAAELASTRPTLSSGTA